MSLYDALTSTEYTLLRASSGIPSYAAAQYVSLCPSTNIQATTVAAVPSGTVKASITLSSTVDADALVGMTVLISETNDRSAAYFRGRVRKTPSGTTLYINATSQDIDVGDYVWIIDDFDIHPKLARDTGSAYYKDYDETYRDPKPLITGLQSSYAGFVDSGTSNLQLTLSPSALAVDADASSISTWLWDIDDGRFDTGTSASQNIVADFPAGFRWVHLTATDDQGNSQTFHFQVHAHDWTTYPPETGFTGADISGDVSSGWEATISAFDGVSSVLDRTAVTIWSQEYYNGTATHLYGGVGAVEFIGRLRQEQTGGTADGEFSFVTNTEFTVEGPAYQLARIDAQALALRETASPTAWDEIKTLTVWRAIAYYLDTHTTFTTVYSLIFDDTTASYQQPLLGTIDGSIFASINDLAERINASIEFAPDGRSQVAIAAYYQDATARSSLTTVADLTTADLIDIDLSVDHVQTVGRIEADGGCYNNSTGEVTPFLSLAPGVMQEEPEATSALRRQVLARNQAESAAQDDLNFRSAQHFEAINPKDALSIPLPDGYHAALLPGKSHFYTFTFGTDENNRGRAYTSSDLWLCISVNITHDNATGSRDVSAEFERLPAIAPHGDYQTIAYPPPLTIAISIPPYLPFNPYASFPELPDLWLDTTGAQVPPYLEETAPTGYQARADGNTLLFWTSGSSKKLYLIKNALSGAPQFYDVSPAQGTIQDAKFDTDKSGAYCLIFDGTNMSYVYHTDNVFEATPTWTQGDALIGEYTTLRLTDTQDEVYAVVTSGESTTLFDTISLPLSSNSIESTASPLTNGTTYTIQYSGRGTYAAFPVEFNKVDCFYVNIDVSPIAHTDNPNTTGLKQNGTILAPIASYTSTNVYEDVVTGDGNTWTFQVADPASYADNTGTWTVEIYEGDGSNEVYCVRSTDAGATWGTVQSVGTGSGGADTIKVGNAVHVGSANQVKTTTDGGTFSNETNGTVTGTNPVLIVVPYYNFANTATNISEASPEYLLGTNSAYGGDALFKVTDSGQTAITPDFSGTDGLSFSPDGADISWWDSDAIAGLFSVTGVTHLATTTDGGTTWTDRGALDCQHLRMRKNDTTKQQLFIAGDDGLYYSPDVGATLTEISIPDGTASGVEVYG